MNKLSRVHIGFFYLITLLLLTVNITCLVGNATSKLVLLESICIAIAIFYYTAGLILHGDEEVIINE